MYNMQPKTCRHNWGGKGKEVQRLGSAQFILYCSSSLSVSCMSIWCHSLTHNLGIGIGFHYTPSSGLILLFNSSAWIDVLPISRCMSLRGVCHNDGLHLIKGKAFVGCSLLSRIDISSSMISMGKDAFLDCHFIGRWKRGKWLPFIRGGEGLEFWQWIYWGWHPCSLILYWSMHTNTHDSMYIRLITT